MGLLMKNVRYNGNPNGKCAVQWESQLKMCGTTEILIKNVRYNGNPNEKYSVQLEF